VGAAERLAVPTQDIGHLQGWPRHDAPGSDERRRPQEIRLIDHSIGFAEKARVLYQFQPGPMPNDRIVALLLRRKPEIGGVPHAFLVLGCGNGVFQVMLPSEPKDRAINGTSTSMALFPVPGGPDPQK
jgi:hypothetical protein